MQTIIIISITLIPILLYLLLTVKELRTTEKLLNKQINLLRERDRIKSLTIELLKLKNKYRL